MSAGVSSAHAGPQPFLNAADSSPEQARPEYAAETTTENDAVGKVLHGPALDDIRTTRRISIPYGFDSPLPALDTGRKVVASGHGGCTLGEIATVNITITQSISSAEATGITEHPCTGQYHTWSHVVSADTVDSFIDGAAEACGFAVTRENGTVTDTYGWCVDVEILTTNQDAYLPVQLNQ